jgi:hypothetical protein
MQFVQNPVQRRAGDPEELSRLSLVSPTQIDRAHDFGHRKAPNSLMATELVQLFRAPFLELSAAREGASEANSPTQMLTESELPVRRKSIWELATARILLANWSNAGIGIAN